MKKGLLQALKRLIEINVKIDKMNVKINNKGGTGMARIICTIIICYTAATYYPLEGFRKINHNHCYDNNKQSQCVSEEALRQDTVKATGTKESLKQ